MMQIIQNHSQSRHFEHHREMHPSAKRCAIFTTCLPHLSSLRYLMPALLRKAVLCDNDNSPERPVCSKGGCALPLHCRKGLHNPHQPHYCLCLSLALRGEPVFASLSHPEAQPCSDQYGQAAEAPLTTLLQNRTSACTRLSVQDIDRFSLATIALHSQFAFSNLIYSCKTLGALVRHLLPNEILCMGRQLKSMLWKSITENLRGLVQLC